MTLLSAVFPLGIAYLPGEKVVLRVFEDRYLDLMNDIRQSDLTFNSVLIEQGSEVGGHDRRFAYGVQIKVENVYEAEFGLVVEARAQERIRVVNWLDDHSYPHAEYEFIRDTEPSQNQVHEAASAISLLAQRIRTLHVMLGAVDPLTNTALVADSQLTTIAGGRWWGPGVSFLEVDRAFWAIASLLPCGPLDRYELLVPETLLRRISLLKNTIEHVTEIVTFQQRN
jgi:Lon protease-like protein